ncbi:MAG: cobalt-precorrin 5A hydrolase [Methanocorpusculum sp.]|uniref:Cobalt-precorrin 5A hydrolase n=1 Tax=Methanocorpusculum petauri TaxID=3002863 RepID=A0ABT4IE79_9EURY|nr:cobalt-precorrin 5A hydrolase [Methanocorpusculum petauri]MDE2443043.1 cobalt-precorrin 5A hydrolase [Methanocorpusculum sp.]MCZ0860049.1 cobalt-precorrin 5A hydrolase [Methanocorpusculum petauri]MDE2518901.1 cobalt-precorrin 5A hydrolase [Methanocorpusculum sp.]MDE2521956.1 cobalt-precorrin 5A hydrolase [Methanocorpusculum sp.]MDE2525497.1 cobalt-precorrin 5A hydrolase [Methanocorpusculum sp.]
MKTAVVVLDRFRAEGEKVAAFLDAELVPYSDHVFGDLYGTVETIVAVMSAGIAVRGCAPHLSDKWHDPAVVVVTPDLRYAVPVLGGHHGGNVCAKRLAELGIEPVISTATETKGRPSVEETARTGGFAIVNRSSTREVNGAILDGEVPVVRVEPPHIVVANPGVSVLVNDSLYVMGVGCRLGTTTEEILSAIHAACTAAGISESDVTMYATTVKKFHETGLHEAVRSLSGNLIFLDDDTINAQVPMTPSRAGMLGLSGVAEPCALALAKSGTLILNKTVYGRVTIAIGK